MATQPHSPEFFALIKSIGETKSKQEEDKIILREIGALKAHLNNPKITLKAMKEFIVRLLYCEMLGHDASFGYVSAIKLTSSKILLEKRVGYLAVSLCIPKDHELQLLIIANLQKDLQSTNYLEMSCALSAATKLISEETIPALITPVLRLKNNTNPHVRKKVIVLLHTFHMTSNGSVPDVLEHAKSALCDSDPSVMAASLPLFYDLAQEEEFLPQLKQLVPSFVAILKQVKDHRLPKDFDYHRLPAPWVQIKILKILALICKDDRSTSETAYDTLREVMTRADIGINMGHAIVYECVTTITSIYPNNMLLENAATAISRFITNSNHNLKYLGIRALTEIVKINPRYAEQHHMMVIDCLEDPDETLKRRTLSLLYTMTNASNATTIVKKLLEFAKKSYDKHIRQELVQNITNLAEKFTPNIFWYIDTMNALFEIGPEYVPQSAIQNMMTVISLGVGDDDDKDDEMRRYCVDTFYDILDTKNVVHDLHLQVISWVLGEYGYMSEQYSQSHILELLCQVADRQLEAEETRSWIISALMKLVAQTGGIIPPSVEAVLHKFRNSKNVDLQQRCYEFLALCNTCSDSNREQVMSTVLPIDGSCEEIEVDDTLSFLQAFVDKALQLGASPYLEHHQRSGLEEQVEKKRRQLLVEEYAKPVKPTTNLHQSFVPKPIEEEEEMMSSKSGKPKEQSFYPSAMQSTDSGLNPHLLQDKARIWADDDEDEEEPTELAPVTPSSTYDEPVSRSRSDSDLSTGSTGYNPYPLSKQDMKQSPPETDKRRQKLKKDLFGSSQSYTPKSKATKQPPRRRNSRATQPPSSSILDEPSEPKVTQQEDEFFNSMTISEKPSKPAKQAQKEMIDFDDFFSPEPAAAQKPKSTGQKTVKKQQPTVANVEDDFFDSLTTASQVSSSSKDPFDLDIQSPIDDMILTPQTGPITSSSASKSTVRNSYLISSLQSQAKRAADSVRLAKDDLLEVTCDKFWREDSVVLALQFRTDRGYTLTNLTCQLQAPSKYTMSFEYDTTFSPPIVRGNNVTFAKVEPGSPVALLVVLSLSDYIGFGTSFMGTISYTDQNKKSNYLSITSSVDLIDLIRPLNLTVPEFGQHWVSYPHEKKIQIKAPQYTPQSYGEKVERHLNLQIVQIIKSEAVGLARIISHENNVLVLLHAKVQQGSGITLSVKSKDKTLCDHVCRVASKILG